jgi:hypothetical protein
LATATRTIATIRSLWIALLFFVMSQEPRSQHQHNHWLTIGSLGLVATLLLSGFAWAISSPLFSSPDDDQHLPAVWCLHGYGTEECTPTGSYHLGRDVVLVPPLDGASSCFAFKPEQSAACQDGASGSGTNNKDYPGGFYWFMSLFAGPDGERSAIIMRMVSFILCMLMLGGSALLLGGRNFYKLSLVAATVAVPLGWFLFSSNNPSGVAIAAETACFISVFSALRADSRGLRWGSAAAAVGFVAIAAASRTDGLALSIVAVGLALVIGAKLPKQRLNGRAWVAIALATLILVVLAERTLSRVLPSSTDMASKLWNPVDLVAAIPAEYAFYFGQFASKLGWLDTLQPDLVVSQRIFAVGILMAVALYSPARRRLVALVVTGAAMFGIPFVWNQSLGLEVGLQPRYLLVLVFILAAMAVIDLPKSKIVLSRAQATLIALAAALANSFALHTNIRRYVTGTDVQSLDLSKNREWWWADIALEPNTVWIIGSLSFLVFVLGLAWRAGEILEETRVEMNGMNEDDLSRTADSSASGSREEPSPPGGPLAAE